MSVCSNQEQEIIQPAGCSSLGVNTAIGAKNVGGRFGIPEDILGTIFISIKMRICLIIYLEI